MRRKLALVILVASASLVGPSLANAKCVFYEQTCLFGGICDPCSDDYYVYNCGGGVYQWIFQGCCLCAAPTR
jgi:hypothetical protein